jgi:hypothetical protein
VFTRALSWQWEGRIALADCAAVHRVPTILALFDSGIRIAKSVGSRIRTRDVETYEDLRLRPKYQCFSSLAEAYRTDSVVSAVEKGSQLYR